MTVTKADETIAEEAWEKDPLVFYVSQEDFEKYCLPRKQKKEGFNLESS